MTRDTLAREYRRDLLRFLAGERADAAGAARQLFRARAEARSHR